MRPPGTGEAFRICLGSGTGIRGLGVGLCRVLQVARRISYSGMQLHYTTPVPRILPKATLPHGSFEVLVQRTSKYEL